MKWLCAIVLLAVLSVFAPGRVSVGGSSDPFPLVRFEPAFRLIPPAGESFSIQVWIEDLVTTTDPCPIVGGGPCGLGAYLVEVAFDPGVIIFRSIADGSFLTSTGRAYFGCPVTTARHDPLNGVLSYSCSTYGSAPPGPEGSGHLATLEFESVGAGSSELHFQNTLLAEASPEPTAILHDTQDGAVASGSIPVGGIAEMPKLEALQ